MFSNDINTRDLFFSNPIDHFLTQDQGIKTSYESGFSSSHNHTGNSKEMEYRSSQDLFSQTRSQDLFSQNDRTNSQFGTMNTDYQKYISQNLLLGKESPRSILSFKEGNKGRNIEKLASPPDEKQFDENHIKQIKTSFELLNDNLKKLNSEVGFQNNNLKEELSRLNERISFVDGSLGNKFELITDNFKSYTNIIKKEENDKKKLYDKISEVVENVKNLESKMDNYAEQNDKVLQENIKKISKTYEEKHRKQLQKLQDQYSHIEKTVRKMNSVIETSFKNNQESFENSFNQKLDSLKDCFKNTINQLVQLSGVQVNDSLKNKQTHPRNLHDLSKDDSDLTKYKRTVSNYASGYNYQNSNISMPGSTQTSSMESTRTHTPLMHYLNKYESKVDPTENYQFRSTVKPKVSNYNDAFSYSNLKIKRKDSTPLGQMASPKFKKPMQNTTISHCTPLISKFQTDKRCNETFFPSNKVPFAKWKHRDLSNKADQTIITNSSPALTVIEAATIAESLYAFRTHRMLKK